MISITLDNKGIQEELERLIMVVENSERYILKAFPNDIRKLFKDTACGMSGSIALSTDNVDSFFYCSVKAPTGFNYVLYYNVFFPNLPANKFRELWDMIELFPYTLFPNMEVNYSYFCPDSLANGNIIKIDFLIALGSGVNAYLPFYDAEKDNAVHEAIVSYLHYIIGGGEVGE